MKKFFSIFICMAFLFVLLPDMSARADSGPLPTIDQVLREGLTDQKAEVSDNLDGFSISNEEFGDFSSDFRILILQREAPEKEFTALKTYPPFSDDDGFPDDFAGVDKGSARIWLRADLMKQLPAEYCAKSLEDATYFFMAESLYEMDGSIAVSDFKDTGDEELPEFENAEEMVMYLLSHPKEVESVTYYPKFGAYSLVTLYEAGTRKWMAYDYQYTQSKRFARNPEASLLWNQMTYVSDLWDALDETTGPDIDAANELMEVLDFIPQEKKDLWASCMEAKEYSTAAHSVDEYFWSMAEELKGLDPSEEHKADYDMIIGEKNRTALRLFAGYCEYSGFERSVSSIESAKDYMASADEEWMDHTLQNLVNLFIGE